jgi:pseudaminic acid cytidylyltransferase
MNLCIIPARGGSKRIPRKNIKEFCGKPIIAYSIEAAISSGLFDDVIVSTDDDEIALVASAWGASVPFFRPAELSGDFTGTTPVIAHAIEEMGKLGREYEFACCIYATAPFVSAENITLGLSKLESSDKLFSFSACEFEAPVFRSFGLGESDSVEMFWPENFDKRSQDLPKAYYDAAQFYWGRPSAFLQNQKIFAPHSAGVVLPRKIVQDIDTPEDWDMAELIFRSLQDA